MNQPVQYLIPVYYQLLVLPYDWSIVTVNFNTYIFARAETNKHAEYVKPSDTASFDGLTFDILTRETVFYKEVSGIVGGLWYLKWCLQAAPPFSHPAVSRSFAILSLLARFFRSSALTESLAQAIFRKEIFSTRSPFCPFYQNKPEK